MKKIIVEFTHDGTYRDLVWEGSFKVVRGQYRAVTPSFAAKLARQQDAQIIYDENHNVVTEDW
ncbi:hypothetical protein NF212_23295 [Parasalinivibrio latis]|uniref:hypothetical protein n=1 Tax=Parasalinivibrio latis TaxID=2952610 RepID=UPI000AD40EE7